MNAPYSRLCLPLLLVLLHFAPALHAHDGGPPKLATGVGGLLTYTIQSDVTGEGDLSFYLAQAGYDTNVIRILPEGTFSSPGDGRFTIRAVGPGKTSVTFGWFYPPHDAAGSFTLEVTVTNLPAPMPPTAANAPTSGKLLDPVNLFTGELTMDERPDLNLGGPMPLTFARYYGSGLSRAALVQSPLSDNWSCHFDWRLLRDSNIVDVVSWEGRRIPFQKTGGVWQLRGTREIPFQIVESGANFVLGDPRDHRLYTFDTNGLLTAIADGRGNTHTLTYNGPRLTQVSDGLGRVLSFTYQGFQQLTAVSDGQRTIRFGYTNIFASGFDFYSALASITDAFTNVTRHTYDGSGTTNHIRALLLATTRPRGNVPYTQTWNTNGRVAAQTEIGLNTHSLTYSGNTTTVTNPLGLTRIYTHAAAGQLTSYTDEAGRTTSVGSNPDGQRTTITGRMGTTSGIGYHAPSGWPSAFTNADGTLTTFSYTPRVVSGITFHDVTLVTYPDGASERFTYDAGGNVLTRTDREGKLWRLTYNSRGQVLTVTNPLGGLVVFTYNADGTLASRADSDTPGTTFTYDSLRRMTNATRPDGTQVRCGYDASDRITFVTDERGNTYSYLYDANNNLAQVTDPNGATTLYSYDARDRIVQMTDRLGRVTRLAYDAFDHAASVTNRNGHMIAFGYDARQRLASLTNPGGQVWNFTYNDEGVIRSWSNPLNQTQSQRSDALGYPVGYTNELGQVRTLARNSLKLVSQKVDELARTNTHAYDGRGLLASVTRPVIGVARYQRNDLGQLTRLTDPDGHHWLWDYTPMGRSHLTTDPLDRMTSQTYDALGRSLLRTFPDGGTRVNTHDAKGNRARALFSDGTDLQYTYDALDRLVTANGLALSYDAEQRITNTVSSGVNFSAAYDAGGRLTNVTYNGGLFHVSYEYDSRDYLTRVSDSLTGVQLTFAYDAAGRMTNVTRPNGVNGSYTYDAVGRLTRLREGGIIDLQYGLDAAGQVVQANFTAPLNPAGLIPLTSASFTYDAARQISTPGYAYDARGRMTAAPGHTYSYDGASRLTGIDAVTLSYNGLADVVTRTQGGVTTRYHYNYALGMAPIVAEKNETANQFLRYYVWSPGGRLLYAIDAASVAVSYFHFDRVGSTLALTDAAGAVTDAYAYSVYGKLLARTGTNPQPFTYIGRHGVRSEGAGLYQMRARYYDPATAGFLTRDPLPPRLTDPQSLNPYQYVSADPARSVDPEGLDRTIWFFGHAWIEVDVYDAQGKVTGRVALNFAPEGSGKSDFQVFRPRQIFYPSWFGYDIKSSRLDDELLVREWERLRKDPTRAQQWNPIKNCVWRSIEYANAEIPLSQEDVKKLLANSGPGPSDAAFNAAPPGPWYKEAANFVSDSWGDFESWLSKVID